MTLEIKMISGRRGKKKGRRSFYPPKKGGKKNWFQDFASETLLRVSTLGRGGT